MWMEFFQNVVMSLKQRLFKLESQLKQKETIVECVENRMIFGKLFLWFRLAN